MEGNVIFTSFIYNLSFVVAYVEGREEGDKGAPNHPPTQVGVIWSSSLFQACNECSPINRKQILYRPYNMKKLTMYKHFIYANWIVLFPC